LAGLARRWPPLSLAITPTAPLKSYPLHAVGKTTVADTAWQNGGMTKQVSVSLAANPEFFDDAAACQYLATNPRMLRKMRQEYGLPFCRISTKTLRYSKRDLAEWLARRRVQIAA